MMGFGGRMLAALALILPLSACFLSPGKFNSTLDIGRDRSFTFTYVGEVIAYPRSSLTGNAKDSVGNGDDTSRATDDTTDKAADKPESGSERARMMALADTLAQEHGYRSVKYLGNHHFAIDYAVSGKLAHNFFYPLNMDGEVFIPFLAIELRGADGVRVKAPGYAKGQSQGGDKMGAAMADMGVGDMAPGIGSSSENSSREMDGTFTLTTSAEIVSQNQDNGATTLPDGRKRIVWRATPQTIVTPTAILKLDAIP